MKVTMIVVGTLAALTAAYIGTRSNAGQTAAGPAALPQTRIAFINIETVFQKYEKAKRYMVEMEKSLSRPRAEAEKLKKEINLWEREMRVSPELTADQKKKMEQDISKSKRKLEDLEREMAKVMGKKNEEHIVQLYKELHQAVTAHAKMHHFDVVLAYADLPQAEAFSYTNIARKVQGMEQIGCTAPLYLVPELDISLAVTESLNRAYKSPDAK